MKEKIAKEPFRFYTSSLLVEITGKIAYHLKDFIKILKEIDVSSIFYHIHHALREYSFAPGQYSNDFARWAEEGLEEGSLAERLASINIRDFTDLEALRAKLVEIVEDHLKKAVEIRKAAPGREFYFLRNIEIITPTPYEVQTLKEFTSALDRVGMRSLYYHFFDARLRLGRKTNDFSDWIQHSLGEEEMARKIDNLDPYFITMDQLKYKIIAICMGKEI
ncbi:hypothetical protein AMJ44_03670 [candidate division WOR-1 bacterium DG_54_3]|uniref:Uncharacterized protein n=1 Tax=candidate division WOR-1 bacterium DG_54_3 TaxID=1703775 RepID=A0A0S7Y418_UNCSA|nr:MAG: hypothetical protein AMJ44_03670 [candidate division WOR-1 bacterium DG_54_3]